MSSCRNGEDDVSLHIGEWILACADSLRDLTFGLNAIFIATATLLSDFSFDGRHYYFRWSV